MKIHSTEEGLKLAEKIAGLSKFKQFRVGAVVVDRKGYVQSVACNTTKTHPTQARYAKRAGQEHRVHLHAEILALIKAEQPYKIYVARLGRKNQILPAKPCPICSLYINELNIEVENT